MPLAQIQFQERKGDTCVAENGFCPDWIADNFDRYVDPFWQHVFLTVTSVVIGFLIAFLLALLAHRKRWLIPPLSAAAASAHRARQHHGLDRARLVHAHLHLRERNDRA